MKLKELRTRRGLTQRELAEKLSTTQQTVARWEKGTTTVNETQIKQLCLILQCRPAELLGASMPQPEHQGGMQEEEDESLGAPFGALVVKVRGTELRYPIDDSTRNSVVNQINDYDPMRGHAELRPWLHARTLDNRLLLINPIVVRSIGVISDAAEEMPDYHEKDVYARLTAGEDIRSMALDIDKDEAEQLEESTHSARFIFDDGQVEETFLSDWVATSFHAIDAHSFHIPQSSYVQSAEEGWDVARFVNLDNVALIEVPTVRYEQILMQDYESEES